MTAQPARTKQIRTGLRAAIEALVVNGKTADEAAQIGGMKPESLKRALKKPHVREYREALSHAHLNAEGERSVAKLIALRDGAASEHVQLEAAKHLMALAGIKPKEEATVHHVHQVAGYVIDISPKQPVISPPTIENGAIDVETEDVSR